MLILTYTAQFQYSNMFLLFYYLKIAKKVYDYFKPDLKI